MQILLCPDAFIKPNDRRRPIMCRVSNLPCAHQKYCEVVSKFRQTDTAKECPGRSDNGK